MTKLIELLLALFRRPAEIKDEPVITNDLTSAPVRKTGKRAAIGGVATAATIAAAMLFTAPWEGTRYKAYLDVAGVPTICVGHTKNVRMGDTATKAQCEQYFREDITQANRELRQCVTRPMSEPVEIALTDIVFNVGAPRICESTAIRRYNSGDDDGACEALLMWDKVTVNGQLKTVDWQVKRRSAEATLCKSG